VSAKISASRKRAFLKALAATGNFTIASERARVSRSWAVTQRRRDAGFEAACREAIEEARRGLLGGAPGGRRDGGEEEGARASGPGRGGRGTNRPPPRWRYFDGEELVVRGTGGGALADGAGGGGRDKRRPRRVQIARARLRQWTARAETRFLEVLGATCNVHAACAEVGLSPASAYNHRERWPDFARRWFEVVDETMSRLEIAVLERGANFMWDKEAPLGSPIREMTASEALYMIEMHKRRMRGEEGTPGRRPGAARYQRVQESAAAAIRAQVRAFQRARAKSGGGGGAGGGAGGAAGGEDAPPAR